METLKGTVNRIIYKNEDTGFHIISFLSDDVSSWDHVIVVKGTFFPLKEDDELTIYGEYVDDPVNGIIKIPTFIGENTPLCYA